MTILRYVPKQVTLDGCQVEVLAQLTRKRPAAAPERFGLGWAAELSQAALADGIPPGDGPS